jgi:hypothetical protein
MRAQRSSNVDEPYVALEKLLELRFSMARGAWGQREVVRLRPEIHKPYAADPQMLSARQTAGYTTSNDDSMARDLLSLADTLDDLVFSLDRASAYSWSDGMSALLLEAAARMPHYTFTESSFPTPHGFVWHASPQLIDRLVPEGALSSDDRANMFHEPLPLQAWGWRRDAKDGPTSVECHSWRWTGDGPPPHPKEPEWMLHRNFHLRYGETLQDVDSSAPRAVTGRRSA